MSKRILIIAGPNGAGKTTFAREYLPKEAGLPTFINADLTAAGLSPFNPAKAAVRAIFLSLPSPEAAIERVAKRVSQGGHNVPEDVVRRRFHSGRKNLEEIYRTIVDSWTMYDASGRDLHILSTDDRSE